MPLIKPADNDLNSVAPKGSPLVIRDSFVAKLPATDKEPYPLVLEGLTELGRIVHWVDDKPVNGEQRAAPSMNAAIVAKLADCREDLIGRISLSLAACSLALMSHLDRPPMPPHTHLQR